MKTKGLLVVIIPPYENCYAIYSEANAVRVRFDYDRTVDDCMAVTVITPV